jgi:hypothetical protein
VLSVWSTLCGDTGAAGGVVIGVRYLGRYGYIPTWELGSQSVSSLGGSGCLRRSQGTHQTTDVALTLHLQLQAYNLN